MFFKQSVVLLFVGILSFAVADDFDEYDVNTLRTMLRSQDQCFQSYKTYSDNCSATYAIEMNECRLQATAAKLILKEASLENRQTLQYNANMSCRSIQSCDSGDEDIPEILGCMSEQAAQSVVAMTNMRFEASRMQGEYNKHMQDIESNNQGCINETMKRFTDKNEYGLIVLGNCVHDGKWTAFENVPVPESTPSPTPTPTTTPTPTPTTTPTATTTPTRSTNPTPTTTQAVSGTTKASVTNTPAKPVAGTKGKPSH